MAHERKRKWLSRRTPSARLFFAAFVILCLAGCWQLVGAVVGAGVEKVSGRKAKEAKEQRRQEEAAQRQEAWEKQEQERLRKEAEAKREKALAVEKLGKTLSKLDTLASKAPKVSFNGGTPEVDARPGKVQGEASQGVSSDWRSHGRGHFLFRPCISFH